jgi:hypothetical protein
MKLETWLKLQKMSIEEFANKIGKHKSLVHRYIYEGVIPKPVVMLRIYEETLGSVDANDFFKLSDRIFENHLSKNHFPSKLHSNSFK